MDELNEALRELKIEDWIWIIVLFTTIAALVSDSFERNWLFTNDRTEYNKFKTINIVLLFVSFLIYVYFAFLTFKKFKQSQSAGSFSDMILKEINFLAASLILIGILLNVFVELKSRGSDPLLM